MTARLSSEGLEVALDRGSGCRGELLMASMGLQALLKLDLRSPKIGLSGSNSVDTAPEVGVGMRELGLSTCEVGLRLSDRREGLDDLLHKGPELSARGHVGGRRQSSGT